MISKTLNLLKWLVGEAMEKINVVEKWREIKAEGKKYGKRFIVGAVLWECVEDILFPSLAWYFGMKWLIPVFLCLHFEPIIYPIMFFCFRTYDRMMGREKWDPDRKACSKGYRTAAKAIAYRTIALGAFGAVLYGLNINMWLLVVYSLLMTMFGAVHERLWHDSNYGITQNDQVETKRMLLKTFTYRGASALIMLGVFLGALGSVPWMAFLSYQVVMLTCYFSLEALWSKTSWGIRPTVA